MKQSREVSRRRPETAPWAEEAPPVGAIAGGKIKSVDLRPRSNGETDWQDEVPGPVRPER